MNISTCTYSIQQIMWDVQGAKIYSYIVIHMHIQVYAYSYVCNSTNKVNGNAQIRIKQNVLKTQIKINQHILTPLCCMIRSCVIILFQIIIKKIFPFSFKVHICVIAVLWTEYPCVACLSTNSKATNRPSWLINPSQFLKQLTVCDFIIDLYPNH